LRWPHGELRHLLGKHSVLERRMRQRVHASDVRRGRRELREHRGWVRRHGILRQLPIRVLVRVERHAERVRQQREVTAGGAVGCGWRFPVVAV
jgi:hypothetical protein